jgi:hypothetical protein
MDTLTDLITKLGLPIALLVVLLYGIWRAALWARDNVCMPLTNGHLTFLRRVDETQQKQHQSLEKLSDLQGQQATIMTRHLCVPPCWLHSSANRRHRSGVTDCPLVTACLRQRGHVATMADPTAQGQAQGAT